MIYIGIDIGRKGSIVFLNKDGEPYRHTETKNGLDFHNFFESFNPSKVQYLGAFTPQTTKGPDMDP